MNYIASLSSKADGLPEQAADTVTLRAIFLALRRWKIFIFLFTAAFIGLGYLTVNFLVPRYTAEAEILLDVEQVKVANVNSTDSTPPDTASILSQVDVLRSRSLAQRVVEALSLVNDPEFNANARPQPRPQLRRSVLEHLPPRLVRLLPTSWQQWLTRSTPTPPPPDPERQKSDVVTSVLKNLTVSNDGKSYTIKLTFESRDPQKAALILNKFSQLYLLSRLEAKYEATERVAKWLESKRADLRQQVDAAERAVQDYKQKYSITDLPNSGTLVESQIASTSADLTNARAAMAQAEAQLKAADTLAKSIDHAGSSPQVSMSPLIQTLRARLSDLEQRYAEMTSEYGPRHPRVISLKAELDDARRSLEVEIDRVVSSLKSQVQIDRSRAQMLQTQLSQLEKTNQERNQAIAGLTHLQTEAAAARAVLQTFVTGMVTTSAQNEYNSSGARVLSPAEPPLYPSFPPRMLLLGLFGISGALISLVVVLLFEYADDKLRGTEEVESALGVPVLGSVPLIRSLQKRWKDASAYAVAKPFSAYAEAVRSVRVAVRTSQVDAPPKVLLITSPLPGDGKSSFALSLARLSAMVHQKVLLVDCDLRRPSIGSRLENDDGPGLLDVLLGEATLEAAARADASSGMHFLPVGRNTQASKFPIELLHSQRMADLVHLAAERFDLVVLDSAPVGIVHDPLVLAELAQAILLVVRWGITKRAVAMTALRKFTGANYRVTGVVLSHVDVARHASYGYTDDVSAYAKGYLGS